METIIVGIDGTGPDDDLVYADAFQWSYVQALVDRCVTPYKFYKRGPCTWGTTTMGLADTVVNKVREFKKQFESRFPPRVMGSRQMRVNLPFGPQVWNIPTPVQGPPELRICLTGYSRGAAAVIFAAKKLAPLTIDYMVLFDPVDRSPNLTSAMEIPSNVNMVWNMTRSAAAGSREGFGNCATSHYYGTTYEPAAFYTTHGGMGGTPWCTDPSERSKFKEVNGQPSPQWKKRVTEIPMGSGAQDGVLALKMVTNINPFNPKAGAIKAVQETLTESLTNVTYEDDLKGSKKVWEWIAPKLVLKNLINSATWPLENVKTLLSKGLAKSAAAGK